MRTALALALSLAACGGAPAVRPPDAWDYVVAPAPDLAAIDATVCFRSRPPPRLTTGTRRLAQFVSRATLVRGAERRPLTPGAHGVRLDGGRPGDCVEYRVDVAAAAAAGRWQDAARLGPDLLAAPDLWLLRPEKVPRDLDATVRFRLPEGLAVAVPWPRTGDAPAPAWRLTWGAFTLTAHAAFGTFAPTTLAVPGGVVDVIRLGDVRSMPGDAPERWVEGSARAMAALFGGLPFPRVQVLLVPTPGEGVRFGMANRGGGAGVLLLVGAASPPGAIAGHWIGPHEMTHLGVPVMKQSDAWLFEGLATYYTYVLQARAGMIPPGRVWEELHAGFGRGRSVGTGRTLREESAAMRATHAYWRVYWAGAAFALEADVALRRETGGAWSLDRVLAGLARCCARDERVRSAEETLARMDAILGRPFFAPRAARALERVDFPDVSPVYRALGLWARDDRLALDPASEVAALRDAIVVGSP